MADNTLYIQITKCSNDCFWYANRVGQIFPIINSDVNQHGERVLIAFSSKDEEEGASEYWWIKEVDCEEVSLTINQPQPEVSTIHSLQTPESEKLEKKARQFAQFRYPKANNPAEYNGAAAGYVAGYLDCMKESEREAPAYALTEEQIKTLKHIRNRLESEGDEFGVYKLTAAFPEVFAPPVKTYTLQSRFKDQHSTYRLAGSGNKLIAIDEYSGLIESEVLVFDTKNITQSEIDKLFVPRKVTLIES